MGGDRSPCGTAWSQDGWSVRSAGRPLSPRGALADVRARGELRGDKESRVGFGHAAQADELTASPFSKSGSLQPQPADLIMKCALWRSPGTIWENADSGVPTAGVMLNLTAARLLAVARIAKPNLSRLASSGNNSPSESTSSSLSALKPAACSISSASTEPNRSARRFLLANGGLVRVARSRGPRMVERAAPQVQSHLGVALCGVRITVARERIAA